MSVSQVQLDCPRLQIFFLLLLLLRRISFSCGDQHVVPGTGALKVIVKVLKLGSKKLSLISKSNANF